ncbi:hypothetical protein V5O48_017955 [Marasmius crinis-equi]|uniref:Uncharacterized protein n=1 Tax=Marasmius crinis-equi TaxID=585013 RepID=A0ABR3EMH8_9AGAR
MPPFGDTSWCGHPPHRWPPSPGPNIPQISSLRNQCPLYPTLPAQFPPQTLPFHNQVQSGYPGWHHPTPSHGPSHMPMYSDHIWPVDPSHFTVPNQPPGGMPMYSNHAQPAHHPYPAARNPIPAQGPPFAHHVQSTNPFHAPPGPAISPNPTPSTNHNQRATASPPPTAGTGHSPMLSRNTNGRSTPLTPPTTPFRPDTKPTRPPIRLGANSTVNHSIHGLQENMTQFNCGGSGNEYLSDSTVSNADDDEDAEDAVRDSSSGAERKESTDPEVGAWDNAQINREIRGVQLNANQYNTDAHNSLYQSTSASDIDRYKELMNDTLPTPGVKEDLGPSLEESLEFLSAFSPAPNAQINFRIVGVQRNSNQYNTRTYRSQFRTGSTQVKTIPVEDNPSLV